MVANRISWAQSLKPGLVIAEIGVAGGGFSRLLALTNPKELLLVDIWELIVGEYGNNLSAERQIERYNKVLSLFRPRRFPFVKIIKSDSTLAAANFPEHYFDVLYLDANHRRVWCEKDLEAWYPKLKVGGTFAGHDYFDRPPTFEVKSTVDEFIKKHNLLLDWVSEEDTPSFGFIKL